MATIFEDPKVVEAAGDAIFDAQLWSSSEARVALTAALAALDRDALIEKGGAVLECASLKRPVANALAEAVLVAVGLIPADSTDGK